MSLPDGRWEQLRAVFDALVDLPAAEQARRLPELAAGDAWLQQEVESLLAAERTAGDRFERLPDLPEDFTDTVADDPVAGTRIGPYRIIREVGRGGMGAVYEAERDDAAFTKRVAIKMVPSERVTDQVLRRFHHERQILARLAHKNIASLLDGGVAQNGRPYFAMEFVEGERIDVYCDRLRLGVTERLQLMRQVCAAVQYAHQNLVVHRDLKPGNVMVAPDGTVKLLDFGIAKVIDPSESSDPLTDTGVLPMTTSYASPEQIRGEPVGTATDIYSLGVLMYELLAGRPPFLYRDLPILEVRRRMLEETPLAPSAARNPDLSATARLTRSHASELDQIVLMAIRKEPERRYPSAEQLAEDIARFLGGLPIRAQPDSFGYRTRKFAARNRAAVAAVVVIFLTLLGGLGVTLWQIRTSQREQAKTEVVNRFLSDVLVGSTAPALSHPGGQITVQDALDAASRRLASKEVADNPGVQATLQQIIGTSYIALGRYQEGEDHLRTALATQMRLFGEDNLETIKTLNGLAQVSLIKADYAGAQGFYERRLNVLRREQKRGKIATETLVAALNDYALVRRAQGNTEEPEALLREAVALAPQVRAEDRGLIGQVETILVLALLDHGKFADAEAYARRLVTSFEESGNPESAAMSSGLTVLGSTLMEEGKLDEADTRLAQAEKIYRKLFDSNYVQLYDNLRLQAQLKLLQGRFAEGDSVIDHVLDKYRRLSSPKFISFATALTVKGLLLKSRGRLAEADTVLREAVRLRTENLPATHWMTALTRGALGEVLGAERRFEEADSLLRHSYDALKQSQAVDNQRTQLARRRLVELYTAWGKPELAAAVR